MPSMARSLELMFDASAQIDDAPARRQVLAILWREDRAAAGRDHDLIELSEGVDHLAFALAETRLAFLLENVGDIDTGAPLDLHVTIVEVETQRTRECTADGGLARAHRTDQKNIDCALARHRRFSAMTISENS